MKKIAIIAIFLFGFKLNAQVEEYNSKTLTLFNEGNWTGLIDAAKEAEKSNQTDYEIQYRLAVAYYNTANYFDSAAQFKKIIETYKVNNEYIQEYLYYSYLFSGREADAFLVAKNFPFHLKEKVNFKEAKIFNYVYTEGGIKISDKSDLNVKDMSYFDLGLSHRFSPSFSIYHAFSTLSQQYIDFDYKQSEYYINSNIQISKGITLIPAYHYLKIADQNPQYETIPRPGGGNGSVSVRTSNKDQNINVFYFGLKKQWNRFSLTPNFTSSTTNGIDTLGNSIQTNQLQYGADLGYSLKVFRDKVWLGFGGYMHSDDIEDKFIWNIKTYIQISPKVYLFTKYNQSNAYNFSEDNASVFVNSLSKSKNKFSNTLGINLSTKLKTYFNYQFENLENIDVAIIQNNFSFTYNTFIIGLKLDF
jgi:hypothetical protein